MWKKYITQVKKGIFSKQDTKQSGYQEPENPKSIKQIAKEKPKKTFTYIAIGLAMLIILGWLFLGSNNEMPVYKSKNDVISVSAQGDDMQHFTVEYGETLSLLQQKLKSQSQKAKYSDQQLSQLHSIINKQHSQLEILKKLLNKNSQQSEAKFQQIQDQLKTEVSKIQKNDAIRQVVVSGHESLQSQNQSNSTPDINKQPLKVFIPPINKKKKHIQKNEVSNPYYGWLPMGSFFKATLLTGVVAPTGSNGAANPVPIMMKVMSNAILPNDKYRYQLKGCFIMGSASGSVSSERVDIRLARISCINNDGKALITAPIKGYVVDQDGKGALRGKLLNRQGTRVGMAMLSGFAGGIGQMFGNAQGSSVLSPAGMGVSLTTDQKLKSAGFNGVGQAANTVAQFYIQQAEHIFPVIVVNAGRNVTVDITQGEKLHWVNMGQSNISGLSRQKDNESTKARNIHLSEE